MPVIRYPSPLLFALGSGLPSFTQGYVGGQQLALERRRRELQDQLMAMQIADLQARQQAVTDLPKSLGLLASQIPGTEAVPATVAMPQGQAGEVGAGGPLPILQSGIPATPPRAPTYTEFMGRMNQPEFAAAATSAMRAGVNPFDLGAKMSEARRLEEQDARAQAGRDKVQTAIDRLATDPSNFNHLLLALQGYADQGHLSLGDLTALVKTKEERDTIQTAMKDWIPSLLKANSGQATPEALSDFLTKTATFMTQGGAFGRAVGELALNRFWTSPVGMGIGPGKAYLRAYTQAAMANPEAKPLDLHTQLMQNPQLMQDFQQMDPKYVPQPVASAIKAEEARQLAKAKKEGEIAGDPETARLKRLQIEERTALMETERKRRSGQALTESEINLQLSRIEGQERAIRSGLMVFKDPDERERQLTDLAQLRGGYMEELAQLRAKRGAPRGKAAPQDAVNEAKRRAGYVPGRSPTPEQKAKARQLLERQGFDLNLAPAGAAPGE